MWGISEQNVIHFFNFDDVNIKAESPNPNPTGWSTGLRGGRRDESKDKGRAKRHR